jgi:hypothetical protein
MNTTDNPQAYPPQRVRSKLMWSTLGGFNAHERSEEMATMHLSDEELVRRLSAHPHIRNRIESLLSVVEDEASELKEADAAEMRLIEEIRRMGQQALQAWADRQVSRTSEELGRAGGLWREGKKNCAGTPPSATSR